MKYVYSVLVLLLALFLAAFIQQNGMGIQLKYFHWSTPHLPLSLYIILSFSVGYAMAVLVGFTTGLRFRFRASGAEKELRQLRSELEQMKKAQAGSLAAEAQTDPGDSMEASPTDGEDAGTGDDPRPAGETVITGSGDAGEK